MLPLREPGETPDPESLFLASLPTIDRIVGILGFRHGLSDTDADEFGSWVRAKLIDGGYGVFRKFAGRSSLNTYLSVVVANLFKDFRNQRWGRWRSSAAAKRLGPVGVRFELLVYRDGHPVREALELLKAKGASDGDLRVLVARVPPRAQTREVGLEAAAATAVSADHADLGVRAAETEAVQRRTEAAVRIALAELPAEDQVIVRMRFWDDFSVADIARTLGLEQKPLYRRLETIQARLVELLTAQGLDRERIATVLAPEEDA